MCLDWKSVGLRQHGYDMRDVGLDRHRGFPWVGPESSDVRWATRQVGISVVMAGVTDVRRSEMVRDMQKEQM